MRILFTGGGTGGHITPIVAVIRELKSIAEKEQILDLELFYAGPDDGFGAELLRDENVVFVSVTSGKMRNYFSVRNILDIFKIAVGIIQSLWNIFLIMPDVVFSKGGYGALPTVIAAAVFRVPLVIHDSDAVPGKVNTFSARFATRIGIAFRAAADAFPKEKTALVGVAIRKHLLGGRKEDAREKFGVNSNAAVIAVIGASQGSQKINETLLGILKEVTAEFEILHQTGAKNFADVSGEAQVILESGNKDRYHSFGFLNEDQLRNFYAAADLIVSRASSTSIFEIAAWGKPSILVPLLNASQDHQRKNAYEYASEGAAVVIEEANLTPHILLAEVKKLMQNPEKLKKMGEAAQRFARIDSAEVIAREILKLGIH